MAFTPPSVSGTEQGPPLSATLHWRINKSDIHPGTSDLRPPDRLWVLRAADLLFRQFRGQGTDGHTGAFGGAVPGPQWRRQTAGLFRGREFPAVRLGPVPHLPEWSVPDWPGFLSHPR